MKLGVGLDGQLVATAGRRVLRAAADGRLEPVGRLPFPADATALDRLTDGPLQPLLQRTVGRYPRSNVWHLGGATLLATAGRQVFRSGDGGRSWTEARRLPASSPPAGVLPTAVCRHDGAVYLGEYPLAPTRPPRVLRSDDEGRTWTTAVELPGVRHVHAVQADPFGGDLWVTTGDVDAACRIGRLRDGALEVVGGGSQRWRAVELAFAPEAVLWGMDCVYADGNHVMRLDRGDVGRRGAEPTVVHTLPSSVYYSETLPVDDEHVVVLSTAVEVGTDRTAPGRPSRSGTEALVVAATSASSYEDWVEVAAYGKRATLADRWNPRGVLPRSNAYVFLGADPDRGLLVNPFNTSEGDGELRLVPTERLADRLGRAVGVT